MGRFNFTVRQLLIAVTGMAIALCVFSWFARNSPETLFFVFLYSCPIGLMGCGIIFLAAATYFSMRAAFDAELEKLHFSKCLNLGMIGVLMISFTILSAFASFMLLPAFIAG